MAATSPYTSNDYSAVSNFRPYELPINDIFKAISAQNAFWDAGAARVKAVYDNALNLKLSLEPNKEIRKKYMEDAEKQLTKLSSMDLSDPNVQRQGFALFKPLFQDEGIIYDDLTTRHYEKVRNDALMYRSKDAGKGYSDINFQYAMQGYNEFINSKDRMAGKSFYGNRKEYTPYYDYTEDFSKALKDCKPSSVEATSPNYGTNNAITGYMKESYIKSLSSAQVKGCLEAGLSTNAQRQLQIEGAVAYRNNLPVLAPDAVIYLSGVAGNYSTQLQQLNGAKAAIMSRKDLSDKDKALAIETIDNQSKSLSKELDRTNNIVTKLQAGDYTDLQNNFENYAGSVYSYKKLYKKALASSYEDRKEVYKADPVQMQAIKFTQDNYLTQIDQNFQVSMEVMKQEHEKGMRLLDLMYGGTGKNGDPFKGSDIYRNPLTGEVTVNPNLMRETGNFTEKPEVNENIYNELTTQVNDLTQQDNTNNLRLYNNFISRGERDKAFRETMLKGFNFGTTDDEWARFKAVHANNDFRISREGNRPGGLHETSWFKAYTEGKPDDEDVNKWSYDNTIIETGIVTLNRKLEIGEKQVIQELGSDLESIITEKIKKIPSITLSNGTEITAEEIRTIMKNPNISIKGISFGHRQGVNPEYYEPKFLYKGQSIGYGNLGPDREDVTRVTRFIDTITNAVRSENKKLSNKRIEVYGRLGFNREPWYFTPNDKAPLVQTLKSVLPKDEKGKDIDVSIISSDFSGGVRLSVPGVKKGSDDSEILKQIRAAGVGTTAEATGDNIVTLRGTNYNVVQQAIQNPILGQAAYQLASIAETTSFAQTQPGAKVPNSDIKVPVMVAGKQRDMTIETYKDIDGPVYRVFIKTESGEIREPITPSKNAYELFEKIGRSPIDFNKPAQ